MSAAPNQEENDSYQQQRRQLRRYVRRSLFFHVLLLGACFTASFFLPEPDLIQPTIQIDVVDLPDFTKNNRKPPDLRKEMKAEKKPEPPPPPPPPEDNSMRLKKKTAEKKPDLEKNTESALEKMRRKVLEKKLRDRRRETEKKQKELEQLEDKFRAAIRGNQLNQGNSASGALETSINAYAGHVKDKLRQHWELPHFLQSAGHRASVKLFIDADGNARYHFIRKSGNDVFDSLVRDAIDRATPFSPPPAELVGPFKRNGVEVGFPL